MAKAKIFKGVPYSGTLPAVISDTKAGYLHRYKIFGNTEQTGVPTPENPVEPTECGERTENLFNLNRLPSDTWTMDTSYYINGGIADAKTVNPSLVTISINGNELTVSSPSASSQGAGFIVPVKPSTDYTISCKTNGTVGDTESVIVVGFLSQGETITRYDAARGSNPIKTFTTDSSEYYLYFVFRKMSGTLTYSDIILTEGSTTPTSYIPYGYKLPLQSGSTPVDIYLGESHTTRRIRKLVLTGTEDWKKYSASLSFPSHFILSNAVNGRLSGIAPLCTHYKGSTATNYSGLGVNCISVSTITGSGEQSRLTIRDAAYTDLSDWETYLAAQYAAGTPVTVWYVLETAETGTLNEPLRKIGDYSDTIDSTQTTAQIPTSSDSTTISWAGEGLAPSQFDSIAEWVNATPKIYTNGAWVNDQTYTYTNGAWVADN